MFFFPKISLEYKTEQDLSVIPDVTHTLNTTNENVLIDITTWYHVVRVQTKPAVM